MFRPEVDVDHHVKRRQTSARYRQGNPSAAKTNIKDQSQANKSLLLNVKGKMTTSTKKEKKKIMGKKKKIKNAQLCRIIGRQTQGPAVLAHI